MKKPIPVLSEAGKRGVIITNSLLTTEGRSNAAKKGWRLRKEREKAQVK